MRSYITNRFKNLAVTLAMSLSLALTGGGATAAAAIPTGAVSQTPAAYTPHLGSADSTIRQLVACGSTMFAVGSFSQIIDSHGQAFARNNVFAFNAGTGAVTNFSPDVNGIVNSIVLDPACNDAFLGGKFSTADGVAAANLVKVNVASSGVDTGFAHSANNQVDTVLLSGSHVLTGGYFTKINGSTADPYFASLDFNTGADDGYLHLGVSGHYVYTDDGGQPSAGNPTRVYNLSASPDGSKLLVMGDFTSVGGQGRQQIFMLDLSPTAATLDNWYSTEFNSYCATDEPFYVQAAAWSPGADTVYVASTGYKPANGAGYNTNDPRAGLCDAVAAFPSTSARVTHKFVNYTGCDSLFAVAADTNIAYIGGHERWANNPNQCDNNNNGSAVSMPGIGSVSPASGLATGWNPTRARGQGADQLLLNSTGLWVASDNFNNSTKCGHDGLNHAGICFFPR